MYKRIEEIVKNLKENDTISTWNTYKKDLIDRVYKDFSHENTLLKDELTANYLSNNSEDRIFLEYHLYGTSWGELVNDGQVLYDVGTDAIYLANKAFAYYLPAYLILTLNECSEPKKYDYVRGCNEIVPFLFFSSPNKHLANSWILFNQSQQFDILVSFILIVNNPYHYFYDVEDIYDFLNNFQVNINS